MTVSRFFEIFEEELRQNPELTSYHRVLNSEKLYEFRKAYIAQRLSYVLRHMPASPAEVWDVGCGYGTTSLLLALNGHKVVGTTLEYYYEQVEQRRKFWSQYGDLSNLRIEYTNIFDEVPAPGSFDRLIAQDTLHHLEPFTEAVQILYKSLKSGGKLIVSEENGNNIVCNIKHLRERGFKRVKTIYDERLEKEILIGDENTRSLSGWKKAFSAAPFQFEEEALEYIRYYLPGTFKRKSTAEIIEKEQRLWRESSWKREFFFFGINFVLSRP